ncbi:hypothetical protein JCM4914_67880 [Streptomyces platensis subsp. malvinus]
MGRSCAASIALAAFRPAYACRVPLSPDGGRRAAAPVRLVPCAVSGPGKTFVAFPYGAAPPFPGQLVAVARKAAGCRGFRGDFGARGPGAWLVVSGLTGPLPRHTLVI